ncbi:MAG: PHP domain-containing protein [Oscillospiraceae bacterium]|nr:PHP domain-containing protein [Oscillospiraceae bacterium]
MNKYYYDLHIHSCLSPCGDDEMTPNNIAGMGVLNGLNIMALTDHNTSKNCPAFFKAAKRNGIIPVAGMELTTAEDIHVVCLFRDLDSAMDFDKFVDGHRIKYPNRTDIFGNQLILDENDEVIRTEDYFLPNATDISVEQVPKIIKSYCGFCYPAHIDREANGIISILGDFPVNSGFTAAEFHDGENITKYNEMYPETRDKQIIVSSDAHYLWNIKDKKEYFLIDDEPYSSDLVRKRLFEMLEAIQ